MLLVPRKMRKALEHVVESHVPFTLVSPTVVEEQLLGLFPSARVCETVDVALDLASRTLERRGIDRPKAVLVHCAPLLCDGEGGGDLQHHLDRAE